MLLDDRLDKALQPIESHATKSTPSKEGVTRGDKVMRKTIMEPLQSLRSRVADALQISDGLKTALAVLVVVVILLSLLCAVATPAEARSLQVEIKSNNWIGLVYSPYVMGGTGQVWGPNGFYRSFSWCGGCSSSNFGRYVGWGDVPTGYYWAQLRFNNGRTVGNGGTLQWYTWVGTIPFASPR